MFDRVLYHFREICKIPHGSGSTKQISRYVVNVAEKLGCKYYTDDLGNVVIYLPSNTQSDSCLAIQGHLDMVCVKEKDCIFDFEKDGLNLVEDGDFIFADKTSLGGDDGIAVAYMLALAESDVPHPDLELIFTVDEETGMYGAAALDTGVLRSKMFINVDSEEEGTMLVSCAGGQRLDSSFALVYESIRDGYILSVSDFPGGHSGTEIDKIRTNAITDTLRIFSGLDIQLSSVNGGSADNAIPTSCNVEFFCDEDALAQLRLRLDCFEQYNVSLCETENLPVLSLCDTKNIIQCIATLSNGVIEQSTEIAGLVQTSTNLGRVKTEDGIIICSHAVRSSKNQSKARLSDAMKSHYMSYGFSVNIHGEYPAWEYNENSVLQQIVSSSYRKQYGCEIKKTAIHAGLECGIFSSKIDGFDAVSIGPNIYDIHSADERLEVKSAERVFAMLIDLIGNV